MSRKLTYRQILKWKPIFDVEILEECVDNFEDSTLVRGQEVECSHKVPAVQIV